MVGEVDAIFNMALAVSFEDLSDFKFGCIWRLTFFTADSKLAFLIA